MSLKFGTDGVRGLANAELTPELVLDLGRAAARVLGDGGRATFLVGRDTRRSGPLLQAALTAGLAAEGADVVDLGVLPTPGVAYCAEVRGLPAAMISASHNPFPDNGIKLFAPGGRKLPDDVEARLEAELGGAEPHPPLTGADVGRVDVDADAADDAYVDHLVATLEGRRLDGLRVVIDCAAGAATAIAPRAFRALGVHVVSCGPHPDGTNINRGCGSTHPEGLQKAVVDAGADVGLAFDGDADRVLAVDHQGQLIDGDQLMAVSALDLRQRGLLAEDTVVVTVMTNLGFRLAMADQGVRVVETKVGDRYVLEALEDGGWTLGGEQSGHVIFRRLASTGDGVLTGLQVLDVVRRSGRPLADLAAAAMTRLPQVLQNVRVADRDRLEGCATIWDAVASADADLGERGRVLLRASGTEPLVRVMVEAETADMAEATAARLVGVVVAELGAAG